MKYKELYYVAESSRYTSPIVPSFPLNKRMRQTLIILATYKRCAKQKR